MKKTVIFKTAFAAILVVLLALPLATCGVETLEGGGVDDNEYTDVLYDAVRVGNDYRVKSVTLLLNGMVPKPRSQRAMERALSLEGARMSHDYFEAVFLGPTTIARAAWEIGQPAGISGVDRGVGDYRSTSPTAPASIVFVGKKTGKTLLGVGYLTHVNNLEIQGSTPLRVIDGNTDSVTFTVSPLATWLGLVGVTAGVPPAITHYAPNTIRKDLDPTLDTTIGTFVTAYNVTPAGTITAPATANYSQASETATRGEILSPRGTGASFPLYYLPSVKNPHVNITTDTFTVNALYQIGGLTRGTVFATAATDYFPAGGLATAVRVWGTRSGTASYPTGTDTRNTTGAITGGTPSPALKGGLQFIKRTPAFMVSGVNYEINDTFHDKVTKIDDTASNAILADDPLPEGLPVRFIMSTIAAGRQSGGIFAITFQVPVFALVPDRATNSGALAPEKWWIRPDYSQYQYLLDNGTDSGGAVLLGTDVEGGGGDWIQINTKGIGFDNE